MPTRRRLLATAQAAALGTVAPFTGVDLALARTPGGTLRIGIAAASVPLPKGQTDQGGEGQRVMGHTVFDRLVFWDLSRADAPSRLVPNLATAWGGGGYGGDHALCLPQPPRRALSRRRPLHRLRGAVELREDPGPGRAALRPAPVCPGQVAHRHRGQATALSDEILKVRTRTPDARLPYGIAWIVMSRPAQWERVGRSWDAFLNAPSGTGPFRDTA